VKQHNVYEKRERSHFGKGKKRQTVAITIGGRKPILKNPHLERGEVVKSIYGFRTLGRNNFLRELRGEEVANKKMTVTRRKARRKEFVLAGAVLRRRTENPRI